MEVNDGRPGRVRLAPLADFSAASLRAFVKANVEGGTTAKPVDGRRMPALLGWDVCVVWPMAAHIVLPWTHRVFSNLKTWALGVYHGLREKHLQAYLDRFVFRFNRRRTRHAVFQTLLAIPSPAVQPPTTC